MVDRRQGKQLLRASECAERTGLTVRALRVYERYGLIAPPRAASGWRKYGRPELTRLNTICVLKMAGLTLAQIRSIVIKNDLPLRAVLEAQVDTWSTRKVEAERGRRIAQSALRRLELDRALSVDQLCDLIRSREMAGRTPAVPEPLKRILELPPDRAREMAKRLNDRLNPQWTADFRKALETLIDPKLERLMDKGAPACDPKVQKLIAQQLRLMVKYRVRENMLEWLNAADATDRREPEEVARIAGQALVQRMLPRLKERPTESTDLISIQWTANPFLAGYFAEAEAHSRQCTELDALVREGQQVRLVSDGGHRSQLARKLGGKLQRICRKYGLGEPLTYARWAALARPPPAGMSAAEDQAIWGFLAGSLTTDRPDTPRRSPSAAS